VRSIRSPRSSNNRARIVDLEGKVDIDPLTELLNRRSFECELKRSVAYVKRCGTSAALVYLDLDGFKPVNDRHGHAAGDAALKAVATALVRNVRASDDEFVVLLWNVSGPAAAAKAAGLEQVAIQRRCGGAPRRWWSALLQALC
jgi:diguanylate cyclase (GGDEF)-like protein